jgi:alkylated DNA nucleotide flippase Atl1
MGLSPAATPATAEIRDRISKGELYHLTPYRNLASIAGIEGSAAIVGQYTVNLKTNARSPWDFWKLIRDLTVVGDEGSVDNGYLYFFLGKPDGWLQIANVDLVAAWGNVTHDYAAVRVKGKDIMTDPMRRIHYRSLDSVVVVSGGYSGPAWIGWDH